MSRIPEAGRLAGHTLIDALSARDETASLAEREAATELALERLRDIDAITARFDEATGRDNRAANTVARIGRVDRTG